MEMVLKIFSLKRLTWSTESKEEFNLLKTVDFYDMVYLLLPIFFYFFRNSETIASQFLKTTENMFSTFSTFSDVCNKTKSSTICYRVIRLYRTKNIFYKIVILRVVINYYWCHYVRYYFFKIFWIFSIFRKDI